MSPTLRTELMSPAGHWPQLQAAIEAGADAVYFGLQHFSARAKVGFDLDELPQVMRTLHRRGVKGYVTFNTLVFDHELATAGQTLEELALCGVDAVIVQDIGLADWIHRTIPELTIHGSTQMSITSSEGARLAHEVGCQRVVLARELSLTDIRRIAAESPIEVETFVHGALCVSYSGQCFSSEAWGGRSANRGQCAQACRLDYELIVDGQVRPLGPARYLLSPGDLMALDHVAELVAAGVACLKIEGRYKDADYVAVTTQAYRQALDAAFAGRDFSSSSSQRRELEQVYSRGLGPFFLTGTNHQTVVNGRAPRHRGVLLGQVTQVRSHSAVIQLSDQVLAEDVRPGAGVVFDAADRRSPEVQEQGGFLFSVTPCGENCLELEFGRKAIDWNDVQAGDWVWQTSDPQLEKKLRTWHNAAEPHFTRPLDLHLTGSWSQPLTLTGKLESGLSAVVTAAQSLQAAEKKPTPLEQIREQLQRWGTTPFHCRDCVIELPEGAFVPVSLLNQLRRELASDLERQLTALPLDKARGRAIEAPSPEPPQPRSPEPPVISDFWRDSVAFVRSRKGSGVSQAKPDSAAEPSESAQSAPTPVHLHALVRTSEQLAGALEAGCDSVTLDYLELYGLRNSVDQVLAAGIGCRVASPRVLKPSEQRVIRFLLSLGTPLLVRSSGLLHELWQVPESERPELHGDFSLNIANRWSAEWFVTKGLRRFTPTYDLNARQINDLAHAGWASQIEAVVLHHLPIFHMEHCVFCRFLSEGTDHTNCGHPCEKHRVSVRDSEGRAHPVLADVGCRNTVFNAEVQTAAPYLATWRALGISHWRLEFVHQSTAQVAAALQVAREFLTGEKTPADLEHVWGQLAAEGTTRGSLFVPKNFGQLVQLQGKR